VTPGYAQFLFAPLPSFKTEWVHGRAPTPKGTISAAWGFNSNGKIVMEITAPRGTSGTIVPPFDGTFSTGGKTGQHGNVTVSGGQGVVLITQE
jgi:hypothetical protein